MNLTGLNIGKYILTIFIKTVYILKWGSFEKQTDESEKLSIPFINEHLFDFYLIRLTYKLFHIKVRM